MCAGPSIQNRFFPDIYYTFLSLKRFVWACKLFIQCVNSVIFWFIWLQYLSTFLCLIHRNYIIYIYIYMYINLLQKRVRAGNRRHQEPRFHKTPETTETSETTEAPHTVAVTQHPSWDDSVTFGWWRQHLLCVSDHGFSWKCYFDICSLRQMWWSP